MPTRWLDQGATQALPIMKVGSRRLSGHLETLFGTQIADKTDWRKFPELISESLAAKYALRVLSRFAELKMAPPIEP